ncbi:MAG: dehypoxanthine futalosine cyclase [Planctomycetes bacterium]|nr:dehypoxanthine futalosine cyclase [Planctomycetota bacterium]
MTRAAYIPRLAPAEALALLADGDLLDLGRRADAAARRLHPEPYRTYAIDRNINFTNVCRSRCLFCAFWRRAEDPDAYVLSREAMARKVREAAALGATHILMQGGLNDALGLDYCEDLLRSLKSQFNILLHCFSPPEIVHLARGADVPVEEALWRLRAAGLDSLPGGGAEILVDRVRRLISPRKCTAAEWLGVMRAAHRLGMRTTATMVFGHVETPEERIEHLRLLRDLQDETGGFLSFIAWPFQAGRTELLRGGHLPPGWRPASGAEYLRMLAVSRLLLDNIPNVQASYVTMGTKIGQAALHFGANDIGSTMIEENVVAAAGCVHRSWPEELRRLIREAGFQPRQRNSRYEIL